MFSKEMFDNITEAKTFTDDAGRTITITKHREYFNLKVDDSIGIDYRDKEKLLKDLKKMSKTYKEV